MTCCGLDEQAAELAIGGGVLGGNWLVEQARSTLQCFPALPEVRQQAEVHERGSATQES